MLDRATLTIPEVAEQLRCSRSTVYVMFKKGLLPSRKIGGMRRVLREDLEAYLARLENISAAGA